VRTRLVRFKEMTRDIRNLSTAMRFDEAHELIEQAMGEAHAEPAYVLFFQSEMEGLEGNDEQRLKTLLEAHEMSPDDPFLCVNVGYVCAELGKFEEAVRWYQNTLQLDSNNSDALCWMGMAQSHMGMEEEAVESYQKSISANPGNHVAYSRWAECEYKLGRHEESFSLIKEAYKIAPDDPFNLIDLQYLCTLLGKNMDDVPREILGESFSEVKPGIVLLTALMERVRKKFGVKLVEYIRKKQIAEARMKDFLSPRTMFKKDTKRFYVLRKWNSFTPVVPNFDDSDDAVGGGYFIYHNGKGTVIDPGYNFIENFFSAGGRIVDIDNIVITHAHNDHTIDFESILTLIYQYNAQNTKRSKRHHKKVNVYLNMGSFLKFSGILDLRNCPYIDRVIALNPGSRFVLDDGLQMTVLPAYHDEIVSRKYSVGLHFSCKVEHKRTTNLLFTSDSGLFPQRLKDNKVVADVGKKELYETYEVDLKDIDLLVPHIGSIKEREIDPNLTAKLDEIIYPNHLGIIGTARMITSIRPKLVVLSEFGEELKDFLVDLTEMLQDVVDGFFENKKGHVPHVLPGDVSFVYDLGTKGVYCPICREFVPYKTVSYKLVDGTFFYYKTNAEKSCNLEDSCRSFVTSRRLGTL